MGLVVKDHLVIVDHAVKEHLITTAEGNPKISTMECGLQVFSLFTRIKNSAKGRRDRQHRLIGDNCPLLYALKQKDGLLTNFASVRMLLESAHQILAQIAEITSANTIIYIPSSYSLSKIVAKRCARALSADLTNGVFLKTTKLEAYDMLRRAEQNGNISTTDKRKLEYRLKKSADFSLKDIPVPFRQHFTPLCLSQAFNETPRGKVILVDDLLASGRTLSVAASLIRPMANVNSVEAICLFSNV